MSQDPRRVVVFSTGGIGSNAIRAIAGRPDLELVGVWVHTPEKVGRDAGELAGVAPLGIAATSDVDALIALDPSAPSTRRADLNAGPAPCATTNGSSGPASTWSPPPRRTWCSRRWLIAALRDRLGTRGIDRRRVAVRVGDLPGVRLGRAGAAAGHAVAPHPDATGHRDLAERSLPGRRRDDGRDGLRPPAGLRAVHRDGGRHPDGVEGPDRAHRPGPRGRARRDRRPPRP